ncbi:MAG: hypothetical protein WAZ75_01235, partial [Candidatus Absconditicoccaceae bacterium]
TGQSDVKVGFPSIDDPDLIRETQAITYAWSTGLVHPDEVRTRLMEVVQIPMIEESYPENVMLPNNTESLRRKDVDTDSVGNGGGFSPGQGSSPAFGGGAGEIGDGRTDIISNSLKTVDIDRLEALVERLEAAKDTLG